MILACWSRSKMIDPVILASNTSHSITPPHVIPYQLVICLHHVFIHVAKLCGILANTPVDMLPQRLVAAVEHCMISIRHAFSGVKTLLYTESIHRHPLCAAAAFQPSISLHPTSLGAGAVRGLFHSSPHFIAIHTVQQQQQRRPYFSINPVLPLLRCVAKPTLTSRYILIILTYITTLL